MRRDQPSGKLFRGSELPRLVAMIAFAGVLWVSYERVKDPSMWRWAARGDEEQLTVGTLAQLDRTALASAGEFAAADEAAPAPAVEAAPADEAAPAPAAPDATAEPPIPSAQISESAGRESTSSAESQPEASPAAQQPPAAAPRRASQPPPPPTDQDPEEIEAAREEYQAISDKDILRAEEMPLYWRMIGWQEQQSFAQLEKRSRRDLMFAHLFDRPADHRGQILRLKLRLVRSLSYEEENSRGVQQRLYEAWGHTDESRPEPYVIVLTSLPTDFPIGHDIEEEVTFCGYFVKLMAYRARDDKPRASPLLVGKLMWQKRASGTNLSDSSWPTILLIGGAILALAAVRFGLSFLPRRTRVVRPPQLDNLPDDAVPIEDWLDQTTDEADAEAEPEKNGPGIDNSEGPNNGGGTPRLYNGDRFWRYEGRES